MARKEADMEIFMMETSDNLQREKQCDCGKPLRGQENIIFRQSIHISGLLDSITLTFPFQICGK